MAYQMTGPATAGGSSNAHPTIYPALVSATASYPPRQGSKRSYDEYGAQDGIPNTSCNHNSRSGSASAMNNSQEHPSKRFRGDEPFVTHRSRPSDSSSGLITNRQTPSRPHIAGHGHPSFPDVPGSSLYLMPEPQSYTTFHLTDPVVLPPFPEPHQAIPQTHWQYPSVEPRTVPSQQASGSRAAPPPQGEPRRPPNSSADAYAWDLSPMDWLSSSTNDSRLPDEAPLQVPPRPDLSCLYRHPEYPNAIPPLPSQMSRRDVGSNPPPVHANHASLSQSLPEPDHQAPPTFLPVNPSFEDTTNPYSLPSSSRAPAPPIFDQPMPAPSTRAPQSRMNPSREPPSAVHHSTHDSHDFGPSASHRGMSYPRRLSPYNFLQPTASSLSRLRPDLPSSRLPLLPPSSTSRSRSNSRHDIPRLNEALHQIDHWTERPHPEPSNTPPFDMPVALPPSHAVSPPVTTTTTTTTTTSMTTRRMSTRAAQRVQEWRQEVPTSTSSTGPSTGTRANESLWDTLFVPSQLSPSPPLVAPPVPERRNRRRTRTRDSSELFDITPFSIHPPPSLDLDDHEMLSFFDDSGDLLPYDPMVMPLPPVGGGRPRRPRRRNTNTNTGVNGSGNRNLDVNINDDADPMWNNMATLHRLRRATAGAGDATFGENTSGAIANHRDRITALMRATFGRRTMRLGRMAAFGSTGDFVHDDDFDDSYEGLMRLSAIIGEVRKGVSTDVLEKLPKGKFSEFVDTRGKGKDKEQEGDSACAICLEEYKDDHDCVKMIRCRHFYHAECIRQWLQNASTCPICREGVEEEQVQPFGSPQVVMVEPPEVSFGGPSLRNNRSRRGSMRDASGSSSSSLNTASGLAAQWTRVQRPPNQIPMDWATRIIDTIPDFESIRTGGAVDSPPEIFGTARRRAEAPRHDDWLFDDFVPPAPALGPVSVYDEDPDILFRHVVPERSMRRSSANMRMVEPMRMVPSPQPVMERVAIPPPLPPMEQEENHNSGLASWVAANTQPHQVPQFMPPPPPPPRHPHPPHPHLHNGAPLPHLPHAHNLSVVGSSLLAAAHAACPRVSRDGQNQHRRYDPPQYPPPVTSHHAQSGSSSRWGRLPTFGLGSGSRNGGSGGHGRTSSASSQRLGSSLHVRRQSSPAPISRSVNLDPSDN